MRQMFLLMSFVCVFGMTGCGSSPTTVDPEAAEEFYGDDFKAQEEAAAAQAAAEAAKGPGN